MVLLPVFLLALSLALSSSSQPTSTTPNDPFSALALHARKLPDPLVCRLTPLPALEAVEEEVLLSFEEWKAKQFAIEAQAKAKAKEKEFANRSVFVGGTGAAGGGNGSETPPPVTDFQLSSHWSSDSTLQDLAESQQDEKLSPHFQVPLTDRFNYASLDCSARVHASHRSAKSSSAILSSKKDKYMLSPCTSSKPESQHVVVELCEDIRIDTVQLANFEFFSGVFKDFTVSVAKTYTAGWAVAGTYRAKNVRGVQSFHPPTSLRDFYRYIRIDFHSHYGNEYYCPISLLRVYGLTHLEQWKWDMWEAESRARLDQQENRAFLPSAMPEEVMTLRRAVAAEVAGQMTSSIMTEQLINSSESKTPTSLSKEPHSIRDSLDGSIPNSAEPHKSMAPSNLSVASELEKRSPSENPIETVLLTPTLTCESMKHHAPKSIIDGHPETIHDLHPHTTNSDTIAQETTQVLVPEPETNAHGASTFTSPSLDIPHSHTSVKPAAAAEFLTSNTTIIHTHISSQTSSPPSTSLTSTPTPSLPPSIPIPLPLPPVSTGGESIYRTIMNRLTALEANNTLYARYVEEQTAGVRDVLKRLGEDVGRVEAIGKSQSQIFHRTILEWEQQRHRLDMQYGELLSRVNFLADEIVLEKRLGIAQLCLLLAVLVFMGLTRGSRGEARVEYPPSSFMNKSMREWGRRNLSFTRDWVGRFRSRSSSSTPVRKPAPLQLPHNIIDFPVSPNGKEPPYTAPLKPSKRANANIAAAASTGNPYGGARSRSRSRTPSVRTPGRFQRASSQGDGTGVLSLGSGVSFGFGSGGGVPRSARRWARSAHLHEVRGSTARMRKVADGTAMRSAREHGDENVDVDVFGMAGALQRGVHRPDNKGVKGVGERLGKEEVDGCSPRGSAKRDNLKGGGEEDIWIDTDVDADESEGGEDMLSL